MSEKISEAAKTPQSVIFPFPSEVEKETPSAPPPDTSTLSSFQPPSQKTLTLPSLEQRKERPRNADMTGQTGYKWDIPGLKATKLQSENLILNEVYRGINNTVGLGAGIVNYVNNVAGAVLIDLPEKAEEISVKHGGPDFSELIVSAQTATPVMPFDDVLFFGLNKVAQFSRSINKVPQIEKLIITEKRLQHVKERHFLGGSFKNKSVFLEGTDIIGLLKKAEKASPDPQKGGNFERVVDAGKIIGIDRSTKLPTTQYTVISDSTGKVITLFPGKP